MHRTIVCLRRVLCVSRDKSNLPGHRGTPNILGAMFVLARPKTYPCISSNYVSCLSSVICLKPKRSHFQTGGNSTNDIWPTSPGFVASINMACRNYLSSLGGRLTALRFVPHSYLLIMVPVHKMHLCPCCIESPLLQPQAVIASQRMEASM